MKRRGYRRRCWHGDAPSGGPCRLFFLFRTMNCAGGRLYRPASAKPICGGGCLSCPPAQLHLCWRLLKPPASTAPSVLAGRRPASTDGHLCWHMSAGGCRIRQHKYDLAASTNLFGLVQPDAWRQQRSTPKDLLCAVGCACFMLAPCSCSDLLLVLPLYLHKSKEMEWPQESGAG